MSESRDSPARVAGLAGVVERPRQADKMVRYAVVRMMLLTQKQAASAARISERSAQRYEADPWWPQAIAEARDRWYVDGEVTARRSVFQQMDAGDGNLGMRLLEKLDGRLRPIARQSSHPLPVQVNKGQSRVANVFVVGPGAFRRPGDQKPKQEGGDGTE